jgi:hypothetical protein
MSRLALDEVKRRAMALVNDTSNDDAFEAKLRVDLDWIDQALDLARQFKDDPEAAAMRPPDSTAGAMTDQRSP